MPTENNLDAKALTLKSREHAIEWRHNMTEERVVFVYGFFNILHSGHLRFLKFAKETGTKLVIGILPDRHGAIVYQKLRLDAISALEIADIMLIVDQDIPSILKELKPDIVVKGREHKNSSEDEQKVIDAYGGQLIFSSGESNTTTIEEDYLKNHRHYSIALSIPKEYLLRHNITQQKLLDILNEFPKKKICVIGDSIIDKYIFCDALGMSKEDPTIVVNPITETTFLGGSSIVASHASKLGCNTQLFYVTGQDDGHEFIQAKLKEFGVEAICLIDQTRPTTKKTRFKVDTKTMLRVNELRQHSIRESEIDHIYDRFAEKIDEIDLVVFSDFNYGCLPQELVRRISELCKRKSIKIVADSQSSSQIGDISRFTDCVLVTPTEYEARLALKDSDSGLAVIAQNLIEKSRYEHLVLTLGTVGIFIQTTGNTRIKTDRLPSLNPNAVDVSGAGDAFFISSALALVAGATIWEASYIGSIVAAIQVGQVGNVPISIEQVKSVLRTQ